MPRSFVAALSKGHIVFDGSAGAAGFVHWVGDGVRQYEARRACPEDMYCEYCGRSAYEVRLEAEIVRDAPNRQRGGGVFRADLNKDHIEPKARGGTDWARNLADSCVFCNVHKRDTSLLQFLLERESLEFIRIEKFSRAIGKYRPLPTQPKPKSKNANRREALRLRVEKMLRETTPQGAEAALLESEPPGPASSGPGRPESPAPDGEPDEAHGQPPSIPNLGQAAG